MYTRNRNKGVTLIATMMLLGMLCALTAALASLSSASVQIADTHRNANIAYRTAESGLEIMRYWLSHFVMPKTTPTSEYLATIVEYLQDDLQRAGVTQVLVQDDGSIPAVCLDTTAGDMFSGYLWMDPNDPSILRVSVTGTHDQFTRTIEVAFSMAPYEHPILNYGMATKGVIRFPANPTFSGATEPWEADIYIEAPEMVAVEIGGNANFDGDFHLVNPSAEISYSGDLQIAGDADQDAIDNHVFAGVEPVVFPTPDTQMFVDLAIGPVVDPSSMNLGKGLTLTNATIPAGRNPTFGGSVIIQGVLIVESPNVVTFNQNCQLDGIIVGVGDEGGLEENQIRFTRNFATGSYPAGEQFAALAGTAGTSILAPGFAVSLTGNFSVIDGVVAVGSLNVAGNASAEIRGTLITYSSEPVVVDGNISLNFNQAASPSIPGGFDTHRVLAYDSSSYAMVF